MDKQQKPLQITILGLGAIGASIGLALGTLDPRVLDIGRPEITGWDSEKRAMSNARARLAVDRIEANLVNAVKQADVVFVTVPILDVRDLFAEIAPALKNGAIVTDTLASKTAVMAWAAELLPATIDFIGGHPLASIGGPSLDDAATDALQDVIYCLVSSPRTRRSALDGVDALVQAMHAKPYYIDAAEHDSYVAAAGHLPLALSIALMDTVGTSGGWREIQPIAGEALLQMTTMVDDVPEIALDALIGNEVALTGWIDRLIEQLDGLRSELGDTDALRSRLERVHATRTAWRHSEPNVRPGEMSTAASNVELPHSSITSLFFGRRSSRNKDKR